MAQGTIVYNGVTFYKDAVSKMSLKEFAEHEKHHGFTPDQYKEIHQLASIKDVPLVNENVDKTPGGKTDGSSKSSNPV